MNGGVANTPFITNKRSRVIFEPFKQQQLMVFLRKSFRTYSRVVCQNFLRMKSLLKFFISAAVVLILSLAIAASAFDIEGIEMPLPLFFVVQLPVPMARASTPHGINIK